MNIQELTVDHWYHSVKFNCPVKCTLADLYDLCANSDGAYNNPPIDEMFELIPPTEEWLIKFGFEKSERYKDFWGQEYFYKGLSIYVVEGKFRFYVHLNRAWVSYDAVHEIQNLFSSLGEELVIK